MKIIDCKQKDESEEIFKNMKGRRWFAISVGEDGTYKIHKSRVSDEEVIFGCQLAISSIMKEHLDV